MIGTLDQIRSQLKVGQQIRCTKGSNPCSKIPGGPNAPWATITEVSDTRLTVAGCTAHSWYEFSPYLEFEIFDLPQAPTTMTSDLTLIQQYDLLQTSEPLRSLQTAGVIDANGDLTAEGSKLWLRWQVANSAKAFKAEVLDPIAAASAPKAAKAGK